MKAKKRAKVTWPRTITAGSAKVKVYRVPHATNHSKLAYVVSWHGPRGRQLQSFADPAKAIEEARLKAAQLQSGRIEASTMTSSDREELAAARAVTGSMPLLSALDEWKKAREVSGGNLLQAAQAWGARNGKTRAKITVAELVKEFQKAKKRAGRQVEKRKSTYDRIVADLGDHHVDVVSAQQVEAWLEQWQHPVTRNTYRRRLGGVLSFARKRGYLSPDALTAVQAVDSSRETAPAVGIINVATWRKLLEHFRATHPELLAPLVLAGFAGLRREEVHAQVWEDISLERKSLRISGAKPGTPQRRLTPLCDAAVQWLMLCKKRTGPVCPMVENRRGKMQPSLALDGIRRIARKDKFKLPPNAFRHSYISHAVAASGDIPRVSLDAGNSVKQVNRHYKELVDVADGKDWFDSPPREAAAVVPMEAGGA